MYMCRGILNTVCASQKYSIPVELFEFDNQKFKLGMLLGVFIICYILFEKTAIGKDNKAIGGNPAAAKQAGVNVNRTRMIAYIISGITVGIAGFILMARAGSVSTSTGQGMEMNVVTALVLGGVPLSGGSKVKMIGAVVGSFSVILLRNGLISTRNCSTRFTMMTVRNGNLIIKYTGTTTIRKPMKSQPIT